MIAYPRRQPLIDLLRHGEAGIRMGALHLLSESYTDSPEIYARVVEGWKAWGIDSAFTELPMLSFFPIPVAEIEDCYWRAERMAVGQALTSPQSRAAGKLLEQLVTLPAVDLAEHVEAIAAAKQRSKIFFRVDMDTLRMRVEFLQYSADQLARILDDSIDMLTRHRESAEAFRRASSALESLRLRFPDYIDLPSVIRQGSSPSPHHEMSLLMTLQSLVRFPDPATLEAMVDLLSSEEEGIVSTVTEALVREGSPQSLEVFYRTYPSSKDPARQWIARGLQRMNSSDAADWIAELRMAEPEPHLWLMLLIAEVRQFDASSAPRLARELDRLMSPSEMLIDSLCLFLSMHEPLEDEGVRELEKAFTDYLQRIDRRLAKRLGDHLR
ncbi:MAG: hypothetical protein KatS3mg111_2843 [Pirellulaceae bacterium]|nr:MAG: hypothetical protein KatS3mg111_2843 [Pirellulaceae bacterium]